MGWTASWAVFGALSAVAALSGALNARRGTDGWSLIPWDLVLLTAVVGWFAAAAHLLRLWTGAP